MLHRLSRRALPAFALAAVAEIRNARAARRAPRSVYDLAAEANYEAPYWIDCQDPKVSRAGSTAQVSADCRAQRGYRFPKKGVEALMAANVEYLQSGQFVGSCTATQRVKKAGPFALRCSVSIPSEPALPLERSGFGDAITDTFLVPGGSLIAELYADAQDGDRISIWLEYADGGSDWLFLEYDSPMNGKLETFTNYSTQPAFLDVSAPASWRVVIRDAFPAT